MSNGFASEKPRKKQSEAPIEFVSERSIDECLLRLRDLRELNTGFIAPGVDFLHGQLDDGMPYFMLRRTWYDYRWRRQTWQVEIRGFLRSNPDGSTFVGAKVRVARMWWLIMAIMSVLLIVGVVLTLQQASDWFPVVLLLVLPITLLLQLYFDRGVLIRRLYRALGSDE